ncbi:hypothetical protein ACIBO2_02410 [Nonomuraea sp. NPDC050022]|uniref:hypothetical protein n=1 Tax=unclassified Nonomuraea TaxID=2593643 RepID=UPI0033C8B1F3
MTVLDAVADCVERKTWSDGLWRMARASNTCSTTKYVKFVFANGKDSGCYTLKSGYYKDFGRLAPARFDGLVRC